MPLTAKQAAFVQEYLIDLNATQAAIRAGYSSKSAMEQGYQLLQKTSVSEAISEAQLKRSKQVSLDAAWVLQRLKDISDRCTSEVKMLDNGTYQFDSSGANRATELIGRHLGMFKDKIEHSGSMGVTIQNDIPRKPK